MDIRKFFKLRSRQDESPGAREVDIGIDLQTLLSEFAFVLLEEGPRKVGRAIARGDLVPEIEKFADKFGDYICDVLGDLEAVDPANHTEVVAFYGLAFNDPADAHAWIQKLRGALLSVIAERGYACSPSAPDEVPEAEK